MAGFNIPNISTKAPESFADIVSSRMQHTIDGNNALLKAMGAGSSGSGGTSGMHQIWTGGFDADGNPVMQWVPKTVNTAAEQQQYLQAVTLNQAQRAIQNDPVLLGKLNSFETASVQEQSRILEDIRRNDIDRVQQASGLPSGELFQAMLEPYQQEIRTRERAIEGSDGLIRNLWDSARMEGGKVWDQIASTVLHEDSARRYDRFRETEAENQEILAANAFLVNDQQLAAEGAGIVDRTGLDHLGGRIGATLGSAGPMLSGAVAGPIAGAAAGVAAFGPGGAIPGAIAGGMLAQGMIGPYADIDRIANDPTLTREEAIAAIDKVVLPATAREAGLGAYIGGIGKLGSMAASALARAGVPGASRLAAPAASRLEQAVRGTATSAAELTPLTTLSMMGQNYNVGQATGQDIPIMQNVPEAIGQGLILAPFIGAAGARRMARPAARPTPPPADGAAPIAPVAPIDGGPSAPTAPAEGIPRRFAREARAEAKNMFGTQGVFDPQVIQDKFVNNGYSLDAYRQWLKDDARVGKQFRLGTRAVKLLTDHLNRTTATPKARLLADFTDAVRASKYEDDFLAAYDVIRQSSDVTHEEIVAAINKIPKNMRKKRLVWLENAAARTAGDADFVDITDTVDPATIAAQWEAIFSGGRTDASTPAGPDAASGPAPAPTVVGPDVPAGEAAVARTNPDPDSRVATDTADVVATPPAESAGGSSVSDGAAPGRGISGIAESRIRSHQKADGTFEIEGFDPATFTVVSRPDNTVPAPRGAEPDTGAGSAVRPADGSTGDRVDAGDVGEGITPQNVISQDAINRLTDAIEGTPPVRPDPRDIDAARDVPGRKLLNRPNLPDGSKLSYILRPDGYLYRYNERLDHRTGRPDGTSEGNFYNTDGYFDIGEPARVSEAEAQNIAREDDAYLRANSKPPSEPDAPAFITRAQVQAGDIQKYPSTGLHAQVFHAESVQAQVSAIGKPGKGTRPLLPKAADPVWSVEVDGRTLRENLTRKNAVELAKDYVVEQVNMRSDTADATPVRSPVEPAMTIPQMADVFEFIRKSSSPEAPRPKPQKVIPLNDLPIAEDAAGAYARAISHIRTWDKHTLEMAGIRSRMTPTQIANALSNLTIKVAMGEVTAASPLAPRYAEVARTGYPFFKFTDGMKQNIENEVRNQWNMQNMIPKEDAARMLLEPVQTIRRDIDSTTSDFC